MRKLNARDQNSVVGGRRSSGGGAFILKRYFAFWLWVVGLAAGGLAIYLSVKPSPEMSAVHWLPARITHWADQHGRLCNLPAYALLAIPFLAMGRSPQKRLVISLGLVAFIALLELAQRWIPSRTSDGWDILWGGTGVFAVQSLIELGVGVWRRTREKRTKPNRQTIED